MNDKTARILGTALAVWTVVTALSGAPLGWILAPLWLAVLGLGFYVSILFILDGLSNDPLDPDTSMRITAPWPSTDPEPPTVPLTPAESSLASPRSR